MTAPIVHAAEISRLVARIREAARGPARPHTLVVGPRGIGKTFLVDSAVHEVLARPRISRGLVVAWIGQDAIAINSYADLLLAVHARLVDAYPARAIGPDPANEPTPVALRGQRDHTGLERLITAELGARVLILVVEDLHRVFAATGRTGAGALRGWVETSGRILVLATTPRVFRDVTSRDEPWFGNFATERLDPLTFDQARHLTSAAALERGNRRLAAYAMTGAATARVRALHHLLGDSIRAWNLVGEHASAAMLADLAPAVRLVHDHLAGYFTARLRALPADQQTLVHHLARDPGAASVTELAEHAGMDAKVTGTTIRRLTDAHLVTAAKVPGTDQRITWYHLREPLLRLHLQWEALDSLAHARPQHHPADPSPAPGILAVLRDWYADLPLDPTASPLAAQLCAARAGEAAAYAHLPGDLRALVDRAG